MDVALSYPDFSPVRLLKTTEQQVVLTRALES